MSKNKGSNLPPLYVSQNYLTSRVTIERILRLSDLGKKDHVIEIGAGKGHITRELIRYCGTVTAYEIDPKLVEYLNKQFEGEKNLKLTHRDFLEAALPSKGQYKVFSNIPFSITSAIMRKLTQGVNPPHESWLVMEKGAAKRFMGKPHETVLSLTIKPFFTTEVQYHFSRQDFHPAPGADVVLLHISKKGQSDIPQTQRREFSVFIEKGLKYGVRSLMTARQIKTALKLAGFSDIKQSGEILYVQWLCLFRCYRRLNGGR